MALQYGSQYALKPGYGTRNTIETEIVVEGGHYRAEYSGSGEGLALYQYVDRAAWERAIIAQITSEIAIQYPNAIINYIEITNDNRIFVEWTWYPSSVSTIVATPDSALTSSRPMAAPIVFVAFIAACIAASIIALAIYGAFSLDRSVVVIDAQGNVATVGNNPDDSDPIMPNPNIVMIAFGLIGLTLLAMQINKGKQLKTAQQQYAYPPPPQPDPQSQSQYY